MAGFSHVSRRLGGTVIHACDKKVSAFDQAVVMVVVAAAADPHAVITHDRELRQAVARSEYNASFPQTLQRPPLACLSEMGHHPSCKRAADIVAAGFSCNPFCTIDGCVNADHLGSTRARGFDDPEHGNNYNCSSRPSASAMRTATRTGRCSSRTCQPPSSTSSRRTCACSSGLASTAA